MNKNVILDPEFRIFLQMVLIRGGTVAGCRNSQQLGIKELIHKGRSGHQRIDSYRKSARNGCVIQCMPQISNNFIM
jgi:hypothetical protein